MQADDKNGLDGYIECRMGVLDTLESLLRAQEEGSSIDPDAINRLVEQIQAVLEPPVFHSHDVMRLEEDLHLAREEATMWQSKSMQLEAALVAAQQEAHAAMQTVHELTQRNATIQLDVESLRRQLSELQQQYTHQEQHQPLPLPQPQDLQHQQEVLAAEPSVTASTPTDVDELVPLAYVSATAPVAQVNSQAGLIQELPAGDSMDTPKNLAQQGSQDAPQAPATPHTPLTSSTSMSALFERMQQLQSLNRQLERDLRDAREDVAVSSARAATAEDETTAAVAKAAAETKAAAGLAAQGAAGLHALRAALAQAQADVDGADARASGLDARLQECERNLASARDAASISREEAKNNATRAQQLETQLSAATQQLNEAKQQLDQARQQAVPVMSSAWALEAQARDGKSASMQEQGRKVAPVELLMMQAELEGVRQSNRLLTQRLMEDTCTAGQHGITGSGGMAGPNQAEWVMLQAEAEGLRAATHQLREHLVSERRLAAAAEAAAAAASADRDALRDRLLSSEQRLAAATSEREARLRAVVVAEGEAEGVRQQAVAAHRAAEQEAHHLVSGQGVLAGALVHARRRLASSSMALEHEVSTWRLATNQAVGVAEEAQAKVFQLDKQLAEVTAHLRAKAAEAEARGVELAEARLHLEEAKSWLHKKNAYLERCEASVLRPLAAWYTLHGYPDLITNHPIHLNKSVKPSSRRTISPGRSNNHQHTLLSPRGKAAAAVWEAAQTPPLRPGGKGPWPQPLIGDGLPASVHSQEFARIQWRVGQVLGTAAAAVDSNADKRLDVAAAAFELLAMRIADLQTQCQQVMEGSQLVAVAATEQAQRRIDELQRTHDAQILKERERAELESMAVHDAHASVVAMQKELAQSVMEACDAGEAAQQLREKVAALEGELHRLREGHEREKEDMHVRFEDLLLTRSDEQRRAEEGAHAQGMMDGQLGMQPVIKQLEAELESARQEALHHLTQVSDLQQVIALREEQVELAGKAAAGHASALEAHTRESSREASAREHEWVMRERQWQTEVKMKLEEINKEMANALEAEKAKGRAAVDEEYRAGLSKVEEAAARWEQQRQALEIEWESVTDDRVRQAVGESLREARRAMEQEYLSRDEELRASNETALATIAARADAAHEAWRMREAELNIEVEQTEIHLRAAHREISEVKSSLVAMQTEREQLLKERDEALTSLESKVSEYRQRLTVLETAQEALKVKQAEQTKVHQASITHLHTQITALRGERDELQEQVSRLQGALSQHREVSSAAQEACEKAWAAAHASNNALQQATTQLTAREAAHQEQVQELESRYSSQLILASAQLKTLRSKQEALNGALLGALAQGHTIPAGRLWTQPQPWPG